jgi:undecaprenyl-diphosphatase
MIFLWRKRVIVLGMICFFFGSFLYLGHEITENGIEDQSWISFDQQFMWPTAVNKSSPFTDFMLTLTYLGSTISITIIVALAILFCHFKGKKSERLILVSAVTGSVLLIQITKYIFERQRPDSNNLLERANGFSFPSGHATGSFAVLGAIFYIMGRDCPRRYQRYTIWLLGALVALMIGVSRVYLGVHYPTDVIGGFLLGLSILLLSIGFDDYKNQERKYAFTHC